MKEEKSWFYRHFIQIYAIYWSIVSTAYIGAITFIQIPESSVRFADLIIGFLLGTVVSTIIQFFFGSSKSSKDKDDAILENMKRLDKDDLQES